MSQTKPMNISLEDGSRCEFANLDQVIERAEFLLTGGYEKRGNWSLAQVCCHLRLTIQSNIDGYPRWMTVLGYPLRPFLRRLLLPKLLAGNSPSGIRTAGIFVPPDDLDDAAEVEMLKQCVEKFVATQGAMHAHPGFGAMSNGEFNQFHAAHAAHHLNFLQPMQTSE